VFVAFYLLWHKTQKVCMDFYLHYLSQYHYLAFYILLLLCGVGLPIPEDLVIILGGYLAHIGEIEFFPALGILYLGAISGDFVLYWVGRRFGREILSHKRLTWFFSPNRIKAINYYFHRYGKRTLFFARFMVGLRSTIFLSSGAFKIPFRRVVLFNGIAASVSVSFVCFLGYYFGNRIDQVLYWLKRLEHWIALVVGIAIGIFLVWVFRFFKKKEAEYAKEPAELEIPKE